MRATLPPKRASHGPLVALAVLIAGFFAVALYRLGAPPRPVFDEIYHVRTAMEYWLGVWPFEITHPPLAKLVMTASLIAQHAPIDFTSSRTSDLSAFAWRLPSLFAACAALLLQFLLARRLLGSDRWALAATALLAFDSLFFVCARVGMTNAYELCFMLLAVWAFVRYLQTAQSGNLWIMGLGLGLALATRWTGIYLAGLLSLALLHTLWGRERIAWGATPPAEARTEEEKLLGAWRRMDKRAAGQWLLQAACALVALPLGLYLLSYLPMVLQGNGPWWAKLTQWNYDGHGWGNVLDQQLLMLSFHSTLQGHHAYQSEWWSWPLMLRPTWFTFSLLPHGHVSGVLAIGNGFIWWATLPVLAAGALVAQRRGDVNLGLAVFFAAGMWLFWALQPRNILHLHYMLESIPFVCVGIAYFWREAWRSGRRRWVGLHAALVVGWALFFYPVLSDLPMSRAWLYARMWFGAWWL